MVRYVGITSTYSGMVGKGWKLWAARKGLGALGTYQLARVEEMVCYMALLPCSTKTGQRPNLDWQEGGIKASGSSFERLI